MDVSLPGRTGLKDSEGGHSALFFSEGTGEGNDSPEGGNGRGCEHGGPDTDGVKHSTADQTGQDRADSRHTAGQALGFGGVFPGYLTVGITDDEHRIKSIAGRLQHTRSKEPGNAWREGISQDFKNKEDKGETDVLHRLPFFGQF